uniref:Xylanolytic transcriptional activator regulatory domain-containing protein n=1 Tax=Bionectria ochroleuca TaxID=29856 RepID=A0A8H7K5P3_BIOOC
MLQLCAPQSVVLLSPSNKILSPKWPIGGEAGSLGRETRFPLEWEPGKPSGISPETRPILRRRRGQFRELLLRYSPSQPQQQQQQQQQLQSLPTHSAPSRGSAVISPCSEASTSLQHSPSTISVAITLYFRFCHRQPIWCFEREEVSDYGSLPEELICSILTLTSRFSERQDQAVLYSKNAKTLILRRIANGQVELTTIESLCLLSCSSFIDGNAHLGQFHLGLAFQLCRSAMLDMESGYAIEDPNSERKRRLFWSLQLLEQLYGRQNGLLSLPTEIWRPSYSPAVVLNLN